MNGSNGDAQNEPVSQDERGLTGDGAGQPETPSRRELIERFGKYAVVAPPLVLFVSKALGQDDPEIHSKP